MNFSHFCVMAQLLFFESDMCYQSSFTFKLNSLQIPCVLLAQK